METVAAKEEHKVIGVRWYFQEPDPGGKEISFDTDPPEFAYVIPRECHDTPPRFFFDHFQPRQIKDVRVWDSPPTYYDMEFADMDPMHATEMRNVLPSLAGPCELSGRMSTENAPQETLSGAMGGHTEAPFGSCKR